MGGLKQKLDDGFFRGKRILVTGDTGFKGSWLCFLLMKLGAKVSGFALPPSYQNSNYDLLQLSKVIDHTDGNLCDAAALKDTFSRHQPEIVFHLAAQALVSEAFFDPHTTFSTNVMGSVNLLDAVKETPSIKALIFVTSDKCYENLEWAWGYRETDILGGKDPYSASKAAAEIVFSAYYRSFLFNRDSFGAVTVRAGNVIGGGDWAANRIVPDCMRAFLENEPITLRNPDAVRPWQHVLEPLSGYLELAVRIFDKPDDYDLAWNFGPDVGEVQTVLDVARGLASYFKNGEVCISAEGSKLIEANILQLNSDKAKQFLNWKTRWDFETTIEKTASWYVDVFQQKQCPHKVTKIQLESYFGVKFD
ncbi:CDP-glucose 4,6-dehydratase [Candidatus Puniceispirillum sp.]|nr:CDP-glucose 4,6-dehydratase [Candidatus Puniceispirillum sp.]